MNCSAWSRLPSSSVVDHEDCIDIAEPGRAASGLTPKQHEVDDCRVREAVAKLTFQASCFLCGRPRRDSERNCRLPHMRCESAMLTRQGVEVQTTTASPSPHSRVSSAEVTSKVAR